MYKNYDADGLNAQYNLRERHPDYLEIVGPMVAQSAKIRQGTPGSLDLHYGPEEREVLDIFPAKAPGSPLLLFIHGGYWQFFSKNEFALIVPALQEAGFAVALASYTLAPEGTLSQMAEQMRAAVAWCHAHAGEHNGNPEKIFLCGHSAGGHLTGMMMTTDWVAKGLPGDVIKGALAVSGLFDLEPIRLSFLNEALKLDEASATENSPILHVPSKGGSFYVAAGSEESEEFIRQSKEMAAAWQSKGLAGDFISVKGCNHYNVLNPLAEPGGELLGVVKKMAGLE